MTESESEIYMSCLQFDSLNDYLSSIKDKNDEQLKYEIKNHLFINKTILFKYNLIKSHIYLDCLKILDDYIYLANKPSLEDIKKCVENTIENCSLYLDLITIQNSSTKTVNYEVSSDDLYKRLESLTKNTFRYINTYNELCINVKNYLNYLYIKLFGYKYSQKYEQYVRYLDEYHFNSDEDIKRFESKEIIEVDNLSNYKIIFEIYSDLISDINFQDRMMFDFG